MRSLIWAALIGSTISTAAGATSTLADLKQVAKDPEVIKRVGVTGQAFGWANTELAGEGRKPFYCEPESLAITPDQYLSILIRYINKNSSVGSNDPSAYPIVLLKALEETFPCK